MFIWRDIFNDWWSWVGRKLNHTIPFGQSYYWARRSWDSCRRLYPERMDDL